ncbi:metal-dependent phosphohydrolase [Azospirillum sp. Sh1]|uniref:metal-dependent phosphohydrolase n=1 Tax=Azospirillum sp. Sh1 TaxID=2607285 RepID=UPI0011EDAC16|nr:metal-dependent phosphohydrolase [Azospirillum sp. Sh1]KAA0571095.1 metal-dependent phosphohydrolase [Azospirillum sp. Sh1]
MAASTTPHPWVQVASGRAFPVLEPRAELIDIRDIASSLSKVCRFNGHCRTFYSVAQHSVHVSQLCPSEYALWGLLHDAAEAYIGDIVRPVKVALEAIAPGVVRSVESNIARVIGERYGLSWPMPRAVHHADAVALATERRDLMSACSDPWMPLPDPDEAELCPLPAAAAEGLFLAHFHMLTRGQ